MSVLSEEKSLEEYLAFNNAVTSGMIRFKEKNQLDSGTPEKEFVVFFHKTGSNEFHEIEFQYNILSLCDSMQYIYNHRTWFVINHKRKTYELESDSSWCRISCLFPYLWPEVMSNLMIGYYVRSNSFFSSEKNIGIEGDRLVVTDRDCQTETLGGKVKANTCFDRYYEWNKNTYLLGKCKQRIWEVKRRGAIKVLSDHESILLDANLNQKEYADSHLYDGANYVSSNYKRTHFKK